MLLLPLLSINKSFAADYSEEITVYWDWDGPTPENSGLQSADPMANDLEWHLYMRGENESYNYGKPIIAVKYGTELALTGPVVISGKGGTIVRKYFILRSYYDGGESSDSNEITRDFAIPKNMPLHLRFTVQLE